MRKKFLCTLLCVAMTATMISGCGSDKGASSDNKAGTADEKQTASAEGTEGTGGTGTYALVVKSAGNPYNEREAAGFQEVIEAAGATCIVKYPEAATAEAQITMVNELVAQGVDAIAIAGNDVDALQPALQAAMDAGIKVSALDSTVNPDSRQVFVNQAGIEIIGETLMDAVLDITGGEGQWAILSATSQAANQNAWIDAMKSVMEGDKYAGLELVEVAYGDDEYQKSVDQTQALLANYPDLKVICAPTTVGIMAAAKVLQDEKSSVKLTGLGLPSEMADYIGDSGDKSCPYMYLWNPIDIGRLSAYVSMAQVSGEITGAAGETFTAGDLGDYEIVKAADGGTEVILGPPFAFTPENIADWKDVY